MIRRLRERAGELAALVVLLAIVGLADPDWSARRRALGAELLGEEPTRGDGL